MQVDQLLEQGSSLYSPAPDMKAAMEDLMQHNPTPSPGPATLELGQGTWEVRSEHICTAPGDLRSDMQGIAITWPAPSGHDTALSSKGAEAFLVSSPIVVWGAVQVFYAPHIATLSSTLGTRFQPIRYILQGDAIASNVFYSSSVAQVTPLA